MSAPYSNPPVAPGLTKAVTYLVLPFRLGGGGDGLGALHAELKRLALECLEVPTAVSLGNSDGYAWRTKPLWQEAGLDLDERYFYPFVRRIFGSDQAPAEAGAGCSQVPLKLSDDAINMLSGGKGKRGPCWAVRLSRSAVKRLAEAGHVAEVLALDADAAQTISVLHFHIGDARVMMFGTGIGMLLLRLEFPGLAERAAHHAVPIDYLLEANYALCRADPVGGGAGTATLFRYPSGKRESQGATTCSHSGLGVLARALLSGHTEHLPDGVEAIQWTKVFSYTAAQVDRPLREGEREQLATRLARKESRHYLPLPEAVQPGLYRPFAPLTHAVAIEGGAVLIEPDANGHADPEFIAQFIKDTLPKAYLPVALWAYHDYLVLTDFANATQDGIDFHHPSRADIDRLTAFRNRIYHYRFAFRFSQASTVSMHNDLFERWRNVLRLDKLLAEVAHDVDEAQAFLDADARERANNQQAEQDRRRNYMLFALGALLGAPAWTGLTLRNVLPDGDWTWNNSAALLQASLVLLAVSCAMRAFRRKPPPRDGGDRRAGTRADRPE